MYASVHRVPFDLSPLVPFLDEVFNYESGNCKIAVNGNLLFYANVIG